MKTVSVLHSQKGLTKVQVGLDTPTGDTPLPAIVISRHVILIQVAPIQAERANSYEPGLAHAEYPEQTTPKDSVSYR